MHLTHRRGTWLVLLVIALQVLVPSLAFLSEPPVRFGFQMFAGYESHNEIIVRDSDGAEIPVGGDLWHTPRPELDWTERYPAHACAALPEAHDVVVSQHRSGRQVLPCP